jgi:peptidoglycan/LPS O-acetylase OafA/YrhL
MNFKFNPQEKEIPAIGLLRGIASAMVCYFHLALGNPKFLPPESIVRQAGTWGWAGVQIFFIISGFVIPYSMFINNYSIAKVWVFLKKRIIRIEPPYLISIVLVLVLNYVSALLPSYKGQPFAIDWANVANHIAYLNIFTGQKWLQDIYWTLAIEFQYYLLIAVVYGLVISRNFYIRVAFYCCFLVMMFIQLPSSVFITSYTCYFVLGILLFQYYCRIITIVEFILLSLLCCGIVYHFMGWQLVLLSMMSVCVMVFVKSVPVFFKILGIISYSLYLVHIPIGGRINNLAAGLIVNMHIKEAVVFISFAASIFFAWLFYHSVEKRFKKLSAALNYKPSITALANQRTG